MSDCHSYLLISFTKKFILPVKIVFINVFLELMDINELFVAMAFQATPDCFKDERNIRYKHRNGSEVPWVWSKDHHGPHIVLSNNFKTANGCHYDWEKIIGNVTWRSGIHRYEVQIELNMLASSNTW